MDRDLRAALRIVRSSGKSFELLAELIEESEELELEVRDYLRKRGSPHCWWYLPEKNVTTCQTCGKIITDEEIRTAWATFNSPERLLAKQGVCPGRSQDV